MRSYHKGPPSKFSGERDILNERESLTGTAAENSKASGTSYPHSDEGGC